MLAQRVSHPINSRLLLSLDLIQHNISYAALHLQMHSIHGRVTTQRLAAALQLSPPDCYVFV